MNLKMKAVLEKSFRLNLTMMKILGYYPSDQYPRLCKLYTYILWFFVTAPASFLGFVYIFNEKSATEAKHADLVSIGMTFYPWKMLLLIVNGNSIKNCIRYFDRKIFTTQNKGYSGIVDGCVKICQRNSNGFFIGVVLSIITWCVKSFFLTGSKHELPVNVWFPFSAQEMPTLYYCLYVNLVIGVGYVGLLCAAVDPLIAGLICHASGQIEVLKKNLQTLDRVLHKSQHFYGNYNKIKKCVSHYDAIVGFVNECEQSFSWCMFSQFITSIFTIGMSCLDISRIRNYNFNFYITGYYLAMMLVQLYFYCYYGATLIDENNSLSTTIYLRKWYRYSIKSQKALVILMERSKRPLSVTAGKLIDLSLETFTLILKRSYSLLAVLKNF